jgi:Asp/Glu/hydantoin racemase
MPDRILVINPNSTDAVTCAIDEAMAPLRITGGPGIDCMTLHEGPPGVESQTDADAVIAPLCRAIHDAEPETAAFVIACSATRACSRRAKRPRNRCSALRNAGS